MTCRFSSLHKFRDHQVKRGVEGSQACSKQCIRVCVDEHCSVFHRRRSMLHPFKNSFLTNARQDAVPRVERGVSKSRDDIPQQQNHEYNLLKTTDILC